MATYNSFEDLPVWNVSKELAVRIYELTSQGKLSKDYGLKDQMQRSAVSISSNIAEGFERGSKKEFMQYLYIARGSCGELRSQMYIARDIGYFDNDNFDTIYSLALKVSKQINGFIKYLKSTNFKGQKYK